jgi:hypothetical protein
MMSQDTNPAGGAGEREQLVAGIEQTRQDLARTVQALAAKADVPARVRGKAGQVREQLLTLNQTARDRAPQVREQLAALNQTAREKAPQVRDQVTATLGKAGQNLPEPARRTTRQAADAAGRRPGLVYGAAGVCAAVALLALRRRRRS